MSRVNSRGGATSFPSIVTIPLFAGCLGLALFIALLSGQTTLALLCGVLFSVLAGAHVWSRASLSRLYGELELEQPRAFPGETFVLGAQVNNDKLLPVWVEVATALPAALQENGGELLAASGNLLSYQRVRMLWRVVAPGRGVYTLGPLAVRAGDPLGFFQNELPALGTRELLVYPRLVTLQSLPLSSRDFVGTARGASLVEDSTSIYGVRDYRAAHPARHIHWKASARQGRLLETLREPSARPSVVILVCADGFVADEGAEAFERCVEIAASLALELEKRQQPFRLVTNARLRHSQLARSRAAAPCQLPELLETLARAEPIAACGMLDLLANFAFGSTATAVCCGFAWDVDAQRVHALLQHRRVPVVHIVDRCDPAGADPRPEPYVHLMDELRVTVAERAQPSATETQKEARR